MSENEDIEFLKSRIKFYKNQLFQVLKYDKYLVNLIDADGLDDDMKFDILKENPYLLESVEEQTLPMVIYAFDLSVSYFKEGSKVNRRYTSELIFSLISDEIKNSDGFKIYLIDNGYIDLLSADIDWDAFCGSI